jgi:hypothetical protein
MKSVLMFLICLNIASQDLSAYRKLLDGSLNSEKTAHQFYEQLKGVDENDTPVVLGFRAMSEFMMCKHLLNPFSRISHFNRGKKLLETAIKRDQTSPELLFFRFTTQCNVPSVLKYNSNIKSDKLNLIRYLKISAHQLYTDKELYKRIKNYLLINQYCTTEEKTMIKSLAI